MDPGSAGGGDPRGLDAHPRRGFRLHVAPLSPDAGGLSWSVSGQRCPTARLGMPVRGGCGSPRDQGVRAGAGGRRAGAGGLLDGQGEHPCLQSPARPLRHGLQGFACGLFFFPPDLKRVVSGWSGHCRAVFPALAITAIKQELTALVYTMTIWPEADLIPPTSFKCK